MAHKISPTKEEFFAELKAAEKDWEKNGGISLEEVMKKAGLSKSSCRKSNSC